MASVTETTFPSKVVEITSHGLLLITTRTSDVPMLFDSTQAIFLEAATGAALAAAIEAALADPAGMARIAEQGHRRAAELFDARAVGHRLLAFLDATARPARGA